MRLIAAFAFALACTAAGATDLPRVFMTSVAGTAELSTWPDAHGLAGLAAADEICRTRAAAAHLSNAEGYVAWLSDSQDDAYCRLHGYTGKRADACGQASLPTGAGPWYRMDDLPAMDIVQNLMPLAPAIGYLPLHILYDETGAALDPSQYWVSAAFQSSYADGSLMEAQTCDDWTSAAHAKRTLLRNAYRGFESLSQFGATCDQPSRLICLERGAHGPALSRKPAGTARMAFVTSSSGTGDIASWSPGFAPGVAGADAICRSLAAYAQLPLPHTYKAWLATSTSGAPQRFEHDGAWFRTDGVRVASSLSDLVDGTLGAPLQLDENATPMRALPVWTGALADGSPTTAGQCADWTSTQGRTILGFDSTADAYWTQFRDGVPLPCDSEAHLYCFGDNDSVFLDGFDR